MTNRDPLLGALATLWEEADPVPAGLVERVLVALALDDIDAEYELLHLVSRSDRLAGTRGGVDVVTLSFEADQLTMVLRVSRTGPADCRVDGWLTPPHAMTVTATQGGASVTAHADAGVGRFELRDLRCGATRFLVAPGQDAGDGPTLATPPVDL